MNGYHNPLGADMERYIELLEKAGRYVKGIKGLFRELDACIPEKISKEEALSDAILFDWDQNLSCSLVTRKRKYSELRGFIEFLRSKAHRNRHANCVPNAYPASIRLRITSF